jgi:hypothetical protein
MKTYWEYRYHSNILDLPEMEMNGQLHVLRGWVVPRIVLDTVVKVEIFPLPGFETQTAVRHYTYTIADL